MPGWVVALLAKLVEALIAAVYKLIAKFAKEKEDKNITDAQIEAILTKTDKVEAAKDLNDLMNRK